jgi:hypothetical protein
LSAEPITKEKPGLMNKEMLTMAKKTLLGTLLIDKKFPIWGGHFVKVPSIWGIFIGDN